MVSKNYRLKLCAKFVWAGPAIARRRRGQAPSQGLAVLSSLVGPSGGAPHRWWGFCTIRSLPSACRRRVAPLMLQFPLFGGALDVGRARPCAPQGAIPPFACDEVAVRGSEATVRGSEVAVRGGVAPKVQTTSATNVDNGLSLARFPASWWQRCLAWCVARKRTAEM